MSENGEDEMSLETERTGAERTRTRFEAPAGEAREQAQTIRRLLAGADGPGG